jgi:hypothetical protein
MFGASVGYRDADSWGTWVVVGNKGAAREVEATGARVGNTHVLMRKIEVRVGAGSIDRA